MLFLFLIFFISNLSIFLKSSNIVITGRLEICCFHLSHIWEAGHGWVQIFWLSELIKYPISPSLLKCYVMFMEYLRIVEDGFYFRGIILLTCFTVICLIFIMLSSIHRYVKYVEGNHCIAPFSIFNHCFINFALQGFQ